MIPYLIKAPYADARGYVRAPYADVRGRYRHRRKESVLNINELFAACVIIVLIFLMCIMVLSRNKTSKTTTENTDKKPFAEKLSLYEKLFVFSEEEQSLIEEQSSKEDQSSEEEQSLKEKQSSKEERPSNEQQFTKEQSSTHTTEMSPMNASHQLWDECKFRIDNLQSWQDEVCHDSSPVGLRPEMCDDCFNTTVPLMINAPSVCDVSDIDENIDVVFIISSLHEHFDYRVKIRNNWGNGTANNTANFRLVFLLGTSPNADVMSKVRQEASLFGDLLVGQFNDHYYNLTFKTMMGVNWAVKYCSHASFFVKMDDDVWINTNVLLEMLDDHRDDLQEAIGGKCFQRATVKRNATSKWYVSREYYAKRFYPPYCYGFAYVGGMAVLEQVFAISRHVPFFFVDDVYVGMCLQQVGFGIVKIPGFTDQGYSCWERDIDDIAVHNASEWQVVPRCARLTLHKGSQPSESTPQSSQPYKQTNDSTVESSPSSQINPSSQMNPSSRTTPSPWFKPLSKYNPNKPGLSTVSSPSRESSSPVKSTFSIDITNPFCILIIYFVLLGFKGLNIFSFLLKKLWSKLIFLL